jgi:ABC transporter substrate binding protein (PQQ-dependent alcohol dehydrogenase system)
MLADALTQFLMARRWKHWLLVKGPRPRDEAYAQAMKRAARRFGASVVDERSWSFDTDLRRTAQQELPLFTQADKYDVVIVADELGDVGEFLPYNTWLPRPVAGTQGLTPVAWHAVVEQWGGVQLQNRFREQAGRAMTDLDYAAWAAFRSIAEAVTRTGSVDHRTLYAYLHDDAFELAAFKGRKLSYRGWNGQLRQPIPLVQPRAVVSQSPQPGFLHPTSELDTLGYDRTEVQCNYEQTL